MGPRTPASNPPPGPTPCLTPSPSRETLTLSAAAATSNSAFFQTLPSEIRHKILKEAFGNYTMHMHLSYSIPKPPLSIRRQDPKHRHANVRKVPPLPPPQSKFSIPKRKTWQWWSCICHRSSPWSLSRWPPLTWMEKPCNDGCYTTVYSPWCEFWPGEAPGKCFIGVMGWLLSCRQAFAECITILYSTNRIHMASSVMIRHLPQLLLPQRLSSITSVGMIWNMYPPRRYGTDQPTPLDSYGLPAISSLIAVLETAMPNIRRLSITLDCNLISNHEEEADHSQDEDETTITTRIDNMVRRMRPRLEECETYIPYHHFKTRRNREETTDTVCDVEGRSDERIWRELPPAKGGDEEVPVGLRGYWVCSGERDFRFFPFPCF
ncbi:hypothetical protein VF21_08082 [Pseudogymnoascus sp. 05NY08]|nr:hypothetical protein VF21_08082 [Pseudogymnoascus sp. 05NY08]